MNLTRPSRFAGESKPHVRSFRLKSVVDDNLKFLSKQTGESANELINRIAENLYDEIKMIDIIEDYIKEPNRYVVLSKMIKSINILNVWTMYKSVNKDYPYIIDMGNDKKLLS